MLIYGTAGDVGSSKDLFEGRILCGNFSKCGKENLLGGHRQAKGEKSAF